MAVCSTGFSNNCHVNVKADENETLVIHQHDSSQVLVGDAHSSNALSSSGMFAGRNGIHRGDGADAYMAQLCAQIDDELISGQLRMKDNCGGHGHVVDMWERFHAVAHTSEFKSTVNQNHHPAEQTRLERDKPARRIFVEIEKKKIGGRSMEDQGMKVVPFKKDRGVLVFAEIQHGSPLDQWNQTQRLANSPHRAVHPFAVIVEVNDLSRNSEEMLKEANLQQRMCIVAVNPPTVYHVAIVYDLVKQEELHMKSIWDTFSGVNTGYEEIDFFWERELEAVSDDDTVKPKWDDGGQEEENRLRNLSAWAANVRDAEKQAGRGGQKVIVTDSYGQVDPAPMKLGQKPEHGHAKNGNAEDLQSRRNCTSCGNAALEMCGLDSNGRRSEDPPTRK